MIRIINLKNNMKPTLQKDAELASCECSNFSGVEVDMYE